MTATVVTTSAASTKKKSLQKCVDHLDRVLALSMMTGLRIFYAPTAGCSPSFRNCCIHRRVTMQVKEIDLARISAHPRHPRNWNHLLLAPDLFTGLVVFAMWISASVVFCPLGPPWYCTSCNTRRMPTELPTHLGWTWTWLRMTSRLQR